MRIFRIIVLFICLYLIQTVVVSRAAIFGVKADMMLVVSTLFAVNFGAEAGAICGLISGAVLDVFGVSHLFYTATRTVLGFLVGTFKESIIGTEEGVAVSAVVVATITAFLLEVLSLYFFFEKPIGSPLVLLVTLIISCLYNSVIAALLYPVMKISSRYFTAEA